MRVCSFRLNLRPFTTDGATELLALSLENIHHISDKYMEAIPRYPSVFIDVDLELSDINPVSYDPPSTLTIPSRNSHHHYIGSGATSARNYCGFMSVVESHRP